MKKLLFRLTAGLLLFGLSLAAEAQQRGKIPRVGYMAAVSATADAPRLQAFRQGLRQLGYVEGQNIFIEYRHQDRMFERLPEIAAELIRLEIDVLVAVTTNAAVAAKKATGSIPIVFMGITDPIAAGLVDSLARPGGNATGITNIAAVLTANGWSCLRKLFPSCLASPFCGIPTLLDRRRSGKKASCRHGNSACSCTQCK